MIGRSGAVSDAIVFTGGIGETRNRYVDAVFNRRVHRAQFDDSKNNITVPHHDAGGEGSLHP